METGQQRSEGVEGSSFFWLEVINWARDVVERVLITRTVGA